MTKAILFDNGGVLQAPCSGNWLLGPYYQEILDCQGRADLLNRLSTALASLNEPFPEERLISGGEAEEKELYEALYTKLFACAGMGDVCKEQIERLSMDMVYSNDRVYTYDDVFPYLSKWKKRYQLALLSDATPSSKRMVHESGMSDFFCAEVYSFELGVVKPSERMFGCAIEQLHEKPSEIVFIDDSPENLVAAEKLGLCCVQMHRAFGSPKTAAWGGALVHDLSELDAHLDRLNG